MLYSVGTSVEPWMLAWPRRARMPPPGRPMFPSSSWMTAVVLPRRDVVHRLLLVPAREEAVEILGVAEVLVDDHGRVRVPDDVVAELTPVLEDVVDDAAEEGDVGAGADGDVHVGKGARPR